MDSSERLLLTSTFIWTTAAANCAAFSQGKPGVGRRGHGRGSLLDSTRKFVHGDPVGRHRRDYRPPEPSQRSPREVPTDPTRSAIGAREVLDGLGHRWIAAHPLIGGRGFRAQRQRLRPSPEAWAQPPMQSPSWYSFPPDRSRGITAGRGPVVEKLLAKQSLGHVHSPGDRAQG